MSDDLKLSQRLATELADGTANLERATALPGIPPPTENIAAVVRSVRAIKTVVDTLTGAAGSVLDKAVTSRDLLADNVMVYDPATGLSAGETAIVISGGGGDPGGGGGGYEDPRPVMPVPPTPENLDANGGITVVFLDWDLLDYRNHAFTEVLRHTADNLALATVIGTATDNMYIDATVVYGPTYYYWVRAVNLEAVTGAVNAAAGTPATLAIPVGPMMDALTGQITESHLYSTLAARIDLIDGSGPGSVNAKVSALAAVKARTFYSASAPVSDGTYTLQTNDLWYDSDDGNKPYRWNGSSWAGVTDTRLTTAITDIANEATSRVSADTAEVSARESLYAALSGTGASGYKVYNQATSPSGLTSADVGAIWTWKTGAGVETFQRWNGSAWVDSLSNKRAATYRGAAASPTTTGNVIGDVALRTTDNLVLIWNGSAWVTRTNVDPVAALVYQEQAARITDVDVEAARIDTLQARLTTGGDVYTSIVNVDTKASAKSANFVQASAPSNPSNGVALRDGDLWVDTANGNLLKRWNGSTWVTADDTRIGATASQVTTLQSTVTGPGGLVDDVSSLEISASTAASNITGLQAQYTVKLDVNGYVAGFGIASTPVNGVPFSDFQLRADRFSITNPNATQVAIGSLTRSSTTATLTTSVAHGLVVDDTFAIRGVTNDNGWNRGWTVLTRPSTTQITFTVPSTLTTPATVGSAKLSKAMIPFIVDAGVVYMDTAAIKDGTITGAKIGTAVIDNAKIVDGTIQAAKISDATITGAKIANATITDANIVNLNAGKLTVGTLNVDRIANGAITDYFGTENYGTVNCPAGVTTILLGVDVVQPSGSAWSGEIVFTGELWRGAYASQTGIQIVLWARYGGTFTSFASHLQSYAASSSTVSQLVTCASHWDAALPIGTPINRVEVRVWVPAASAAAGCYRPQITVRTYKK